MIRARLHTALVWFTGQGDELETPTNRRAHSCDEDCLTYGCLWALRETELASDVAPDAQRVIAPPLCTRSDEDTYLFHKRWSKLIATGAMAAFAGLIKLAKVLVVLAGARSLT